MLLEKVAFLKGNYYDSSLSLTYSSVLKGDKEVLKQIISHDFNPNEKSQIFVDQEINLPRVKLRDYIKTTNCKLTNSLDKATHYVTNEDALSELFTRMTEYTLRIDSLPSEIFDDSLFEGFDLSIYPYKFVIIENYSAKNIISEYLDNNYKIDFDDLLNYKVIYKLNENEKFNTLKSLKLIHSNILLDKVNKDSIIIDEDYYNQLVTMITSNDTANVTLAMELMANCDYKKSAPYLLSLFYNYSGIFYDSRSKNHVNFKSLLDYWNLRPGALGVNVNQGIDLLYNKNILTKENLDIFIKHAIVKDILVNSARGHTVYNIKSFYLENNQIQETIQPEPYLIDITDAKYN
jgi:hypothetical protein